MKKVWMISAMAVFFGVFCFIALSSTSANSDAKTAPKTVTFTKDVAPILYKSCAECHRPGEIAPMSLLTYKDARPWAKSIREKVADKVMPPWHADPNHGEWRNDRRLGQRRRPRRRSEGFARHARVHARLADWQTGRDFLDS